MLSALAVAAPVFDWHALAPEIILVVTIATVLVSDLIVPDRNGGRSALIASIGVLGAMIPIITLASSSHERSMFGGAFVVDHYAIALAGFFLLATWVTILLSFDYISEGDYYKSEYYVLLLTSAFGMVMMVSARDLITLFVALETISIPTFILATFRKHDRESNEAGVKYYIIGVLSSALMLYGMSIIFGVTGSTKLVEIGRYVGTHGTEPLLVVAVFLSLIGFAFKVSAVPFHFWAPDTYEGAPTPVTAFLSVASKAGGFVALINIIYFGFYGSHGRGAHAWWGAVWVLAALVDDLRQPRRPAPNQHRPHAGVLVDRPGWIHAGAVRGRRHCRLRRQSPGCRRSHERGRDLPLDLRRDEPRCVRGRDRGCPPHGQRRDLVVLGLVRDVTGSRRDDDALHGVTRGHPAARRLVRQVRDVPIDHRRGHGLGNPARHHRGGELGDRVLLLLRGRAQDVVRRARRRHRPLADPGSARTGRRHRARWARSW